jgi:hypothetical protein
MTRFLYLVRHGEASPHDGPLSPAGQEQAQLTGRLKDVPFSAVYHGLLPRAAQTAELIAAGLPGVPRRLPRHPAPRLRLIVDRCPPLGVVTIHSRLAREARMALMFLNGDGMRGGRAHYTIEGVPLVGERRTAPLYRFFSVRDEFPALYPAAEGGRPIAGELYDVPMGPLSALLATEPPELELAIIELEGGELSFAMVLREAEHALGIHKDITSYGGWHAYRAAALSEAPDKRRPQLLGL